jgi:hypothetical protein
VGGRWGKGRKVEERRGRRSGGRGGEERWDSQAITAHTHRIRNTPPQCDNVVLWSGSLFFLNPHMPIRIPTKATITVTNANEQITTPKAYLQHNRMKSSARYFARSHGPTMQCTDHNKGLSLAL